MGTSNPSAEERAWALRQEAIDICDRFGWTPRCIGYGEHKIGVPEIYEELRFLQKVLAVYVSQALIDCCQRHQLWTPLFEDVEARIWLFLGERRRAEARWKKLLNHSQKNIRDIAQDALAEITLQTNKNERLATEVSQALDRGKRGEVEVLLIQSILRANNFDEPLLKNVLETTAMNWKFAENYPPDSNLQKHQLLLNLFDHQLDEWEIGFEQ